jgi:hypothetical protein
MGLPELKPRVMPVSIVSSCVNGYRQSAHIDATQVA